MSSGRETGNFVTDNLFGRHRFVKRNKDGFFVLFRIFIFGNCLILKPVREMTKNKRYLYAASVMLATMGNYICRQNLNIAIVDMTKRYFGGKFQ